MDKYKSFQDSIKTAVDKFRSWDKDKIIRIISHLDADGISASAILINLLNKENRKYSISIVPQLNREKIIELSKESYPYFIFSDLGSGQIKDLNELLNKEIIVLDHHKLDDSKANKNITHVNPHLQGIDGSKEISGAGVTYLFAVEINKSNKELAHIAVIGAIGDVQEEKGNFLKLNKQILEDAINNKTIKVKKGLRLFGIQTKPLHKVLEYSTDPYIPGVSGSESGAIQFLHQIGIEPKKGNNWKKIVHLTDDEMKKLVTGIIMKRLNETSPEDVLGNIYILPNEKQESPTRDAREYATLLNACGRMEKASFGIGACLGIKKDIQRALQTLSEYKKEIVTAINWYHENKNSKDILHDNGLLIINAKDNISSTIIGTLASIISKSNNLKKNTYILSLARTLEGTTKVSLRVSSNNEDIDLRNILKEIVKSAGGEAGGHQYAAGALVDTEKEEKFIETAKQILKNLALEESITN
jgi:RecJ-like exonuclease